MVKFGRHLQFYLESDEQSSNRNDPFIVPYTDIKDEIASSQAQFVHAWQVSLNAASDDYLRRIRVMIEEIFADLARLPGWDEQRVRGLPLDEAMSCYASNMKENRSRDLFSRMKKIYSSTSINVEALRKLVKKFDKNAVGRGDDLLSSTILPELYSSPMMAYSTLEVHIEMFRDTLGHVKDTEEDTDTDTDSIMHSLRKKATLATKDSFDVKRRADELAWLHDTITNNVPSTVLPSLVAHRGFHCPRDESGKRPLENSLASMEVAWTQGIHLCECDIAVTKDEVLILAHDENFSRLALHPSNVTSTKKVQDLTLKEVISLTFKSGTRPPLLLDVLRSAQAIGGHARLVIELKPGNQEACAALFRFFQQNEDLIERCAAIMSFDAYTMHKLKLEMNKLQESLVARTGVSPNSLTTEEKKVENDLKHQVPLMPEILLITVAEIPQDHYELYVSVDDFSPVYGWLQHEDKPALDGVYLQFQHEMLTPKGLMSLRELSNRVRVGIWQYFGDPDDIDTVTTLTMEGGVSYVNTDLPRSFLTLA